MPISDYATESAKEQEGVKCFYGDFWIRLARAGGSNKKYEKLLNEISAPHRRAMELNKLPDDIYLGLLREVYAGAVVREWGGDGMVENGSPLPCTPENVKRIFEEYPDLFAQVIKDAQNFETFRKEQLRIDSGNS